jgi:hypothetical protein
MKKQAGLTIIKLMVLLLAAGFIGLFAINALIRYRCQTDSLAHMCTQKTSLSTYGNHFLLP